MSSIAEQYVQAWRTLTFVGKALARAADATSPTPPRNASKDETAAPEGDGVPIRRLI